ncbi:MAG: DUF433 domain-containing protein [Oscillatoriales cyanobacterium C42_A2020_001]|nr:DUF433 domain-containing protein [Leptolyngbyaceae cyanobacterium C42_A2020_001]
MTTITTDIGTLIESSPEIRGGKPCLTGTGVTVHRVVGWYKLGLTPEEILERMGHPTLTLAHVYAALTYYQVNQAAIETEFAAEEVKTERLMQQHFQFESR